MESPLQWPMCDAHQDELLDYYFKELQVAFGALKYDINFEELEVEWRRMYPIAWTDFTRFMLGWLPI